MQTVAVALRHFGEPQKATVVVQGRPPVAVDLKTATVSVEVPVPAVEKETSFQVAVKVGEKTLAAHEVTLKPVRKWVIYVLPHSHVDIGYTQVQTEVEHDHWQYYEQAMTPSRRTADYPPGAQFRWNVEVLWATDSYLKQATPEKQQEFIDAVRKGWIGLDALYGNELTALCRPEELVRLVDYARRVSRRCGVAIDSAMISDVPGYTWGLSRCWPKPASSISPSAPTAATGSAIRWRPGATGPSGGSRHRGGRRCSAGYPDGLLPGVSTPPAQVLDLVRQTESAATTRTT